MRARWVVGGIGALVVGAFVFWLTRPSWSEDWHSVMALADGGAMVETVRVETGVPRARREVETELSRVGRDGEVSWTLARRDETLSRGHLASLDPEDGVFVWLEDSESVPLGWTLSALSADGAVLWRQEVEDVVIDALVVGDTLWTRSATAIEVRALASGALLNTHRQDPMSVFSDGSAFASRRAISGGVTAESETMDTLMDRNPCIVGGSQVGAARPSFREPKTHRLVWLDRGGQETVKPLVGLTADLADEWGLYVSSSLCGRRGTADILGLRVSTKRRSLIAVDRASGRVGWSIELGAEPLKTWSRWLSRADEERVLPRFVAVLSERASEPSAGGSLARQSLEQPEPSHEAFDLMVVDLDEGRVKWSLALPTSHKEPRILRSDCCQIVVWPDGERLGVIDSQRGELLKVVDWAGPDRVEDQRQIAGDILWFHGPSVGAVRLPGLDVVVGEVPRLSEVSAGVHRRVRTH